MVALRSVSLKMAIMSIASNRGHNSIAVFAVSPDEYTLENIQIISTEGIFQEIFALDPENNYLGMCKPKHG